MGDLRLGNSIGYVVGGGGLIVWKESETAERTSDNESCSEAHRAGRGCGSQSQFERLDGAR